jgi:hypothetical protein
MTMMKRCYDDVTLRSSVFIVWAKKLFVWAFRACAYTRVLLLFAFSSLSLSIEALSIHS